MYYKRCKWKQKLSLFMAMLFLAMSFQGIPVKAIGEKPLGCEDFFTKPSFTVRTFINTQTEQEYHATVIVENTGDQPIESWYLAFETPDEIQTNWDSEVVEHKESTYVFKNDHDMQDIPAHGWISFGYTATYEGEIHTPENIYMPFKIAEISKDSYEWEWKEKADENTASVILTNKTDKDIEDWMVEFDLNGNDVYVNNGQLLAQNGDHFIVKNDYYNANLYAEEKVSFRLGWEYSEDEVELKNLKVYAVVYAPECKSYVAGEREETVSGNDAEEIISEEEESVEESESETLGEAVESKEPVLEDIDEIFESDTTTVETEETAVETEEFAENEDAVVETEETVESEEAVVETEEAVESVEAVVEIEEAVDRVEAILEIKENIEGAGTIKKYEEPPKTTVESEETADSEERAMESEEIAETAVECEEVAETAVEEVIESEEVTETTVEEAVESEEITETTVEDEEVAETTVEDEEAVESEETTEENEEAVEESTEEKASWELYPGLDSDGDDVPDETEISIGWNPYCPDSDNDSMPDGFEWNTIQAYNLRKLKDAANGKEVSEQDFITDVISHEDYDHDYMMNRDEYLYGTDPLNPDSDGDRISDIDEAFAHHCDPTKYDTDDDGMGDGLERELKMNPLNPDSDGDGVIDGEEITTQTIVLTSDKEVAYAPYLIITGKGDYTRKVKMSLDDIFTPDLESVENDLVREGINFNRILFETSEDITFEEAKICYPFSWDIKDFADLEPYAVAQVDENDLLKPLETRVDRYYWRVEAPLTRLEPVYLMDTRVYYESLNNAYLLGNSKYEEFDDKEYILLDESLSWEEANNYADLMDAKIVSVDSEEEKEFLDGFIERNGKKDQYWIGGEDCDSFTSGKLSVWKGGEITPYSYISAEENGGLQADGRYHYKYHRIIKSDDLFTDRREEWGEIVSSYPIFLMEYEDGTDIYGNKITHSQFCAYDPNPGNDATVWVDLLNWRYEDYGKIITFGGIGGTSETTIKEQIYLRKTGGPIPYMALNIDRCHSLDQTRCVNGEWIKQTQFVDSYEKRKFHVDSNNIPTFRFWGDVFDYFEKGHITGQINPNADITGTQQILTGALLKRNVDPNRPYKLYLSNFNTFVEIKEDPKKGNLKVDTDGDTIPDLIELKELVYNEIPREMQVVLEEGESRDVPVWSCRSNPASKDSDGDKLDDNVDVHPRAWDYAVMDIVDPDTIVLNTNNLFQWTGIRDYNGYAVDLCDRAVVTVLFDILTALVESNAKEKIRDKAKSYLVTDEDLDRYMNMMINVVANDKYDYSAKEIALLWEFDPEGVKFYLRNKDSDFRRQCHIEILGGVLPDLNQKDWDKFFQIDMHYETVNRYQSQVLEQLILGKGSSHTTMTGSILQASLGCVPYFGTILGIRDFVYDTCNFDTSGNIETIIEYVSNAGSLLLTKVQYHNSFEMSYLIPRTAHGLEVDRCFNKYDVLTKAWNLSSLNITEKETVNGVEYMKIQLNEQQTRDFKNLDIKAIPYRRMYGDDKVYETRVLYALTTYSDLLEDVAKQDHVIFEATIQKIAKKILDYDYDKEISEETYKAIVEHTRL